MSTAADLVAAPPAMPPYDIVRAARAELRVTDLAASEHFYVDLLGILVGDTHPRRSVSARVGGAWTPLADPAARAGGCRRKLRLPSPP